LNGELKPGETNTRLKTSNRNGGVTIPGGVAWRTKGSPLQALFLENEPRFL
jgi:hypothetical protein